MSFRRHLPFKISISEQSMVLCNEYPQQVNLASFYFATSTNASYLKKKLVAPPLIIFCWYNISN